MARTGISKYKAEQALGLFGTYGQEELSKAYREKVKSCHPDAGGTEAAMIEVNAAKKRLDACFIDDKHVKIECSASEDMKSEEAFYASKNAEGMDETMKEWLDFFATVRSDMGADDDAPFAENDYTKKPQDKWDVADWDAFISFRPTESYRDDYIMQSIKDWTPRHFELAESGNIDVSKWSAADWYFYWFTNARNPREDDFVYTRLKATPLHGPYAERARAEAMPGYHKVKDALYNKNTMTYAQTPYGPVNIESFERTAWNWNVGIPFAYAACHDYDRWLEMNLEAQREASRWDRKRKEPLVAEVAGWTGADLDSVNDDAAKAKIYDCEEQRKESDERHIEVTDVSDVPTKKPFLDPTQQQGAKNAWEAKVKKAETAPYRNMGYDADMEMRLMNGAKAYYNRNKIENAPAWYNGLNAVLNKMPWKTLWWVILIIWFAATVASTGVDGMTGGLICLVIVLGLMNLGGYFSNMIRGLLRGMLDGSLKIWAKATHTDIDWTAARDVEF